MSLTLKTILGQVNNISFLVNENFDRLKNAVLLKDGSEPMQGNLDMNLNDIINIRSLDVSNLTLDGTPLTNESPLDIPQTVYVDTVSDLISVDTSSLGQYQQFSVAGYHSVGDGGGGYFYWDANEDKANHNGGTIIDPNIAFPTDWSNTTQQSTWFTAGTGAGCWKRIYKDSVNVKWFGAKGDGVTDDTQAIKATLTAVPKSTVDGGGKTFRYEGTVGIAAVCSKIQNANFISANPSALLNIPNNEDFTIDNCSFDGGRGGFTETWNKFTTYNGIDSIQPALRYIEANNTNGTIRITNCSFTNMFNESCLYLVGTGTFYYDNLYFKNIANKTFHSYHSETGGGSTYASDIHCEDIGILPDSFNYYDGSTTITVNYGDAGMPMPQGSFANIVTFGNYSASNIYVKNYASCGIVFDRNENAIGTNIVIENDNPKSISNNPSGAIWDEFCTTFQLTNFKIVLADRGADVGDSSALQIATPTNSIRNISNGYIDISAVNINKSIRISSSGGGVKSLSNIYSKDNMTSTIGLAMNYMTTAVSKDKLYIDSCTFETYRLQISPCDFLTISNSDINSVFTGGYFNYDSTVAGISNVQQNITFVNGKFTGSPFKFSFPTNDITLIGCKFSSDLSFETTNKKIRISDCFMGGRTLFVGAGIDYVNLTNNLFSRRIHFAPDSVNIFSITGNTIGNNESAYTIWLENTPIAGTVTNNNILILTGTVGAGYINAVTGVIETNNNKVTTTYDFS